MRPKIEFYYQTSTSDLISEVRFGQKSLEISLICYINQDRASMTSKGTLISLENRKKIAKILRQKYGQIGKFSSS